MKKNRLFKLTIAAVLLATLLTGCHEAGDKPSTSAGTTETTTDSVVTTTAETTEMTIPGPDPLVECIHFFESYNDFDDFYEQFSTANTESFVTVAWEESEQSKIWYAFFGGIKRMSIANAPIYDIPFSDCEFSFDFYFKQSDGAQVIDWYEEFDYAVMGISYILDEPIHSLEGAQIRPRDDWDIWQAMSFPEVSGDKRYFDVYLGDTLLLSFITVVAVDDAEHLHEEMCELVLNRLVYMSGDMEG